MTAELSPFFPDVPERLAAAHLVIARAGASTQLPLIMFRLDHKVAIVTGAARGVGAAITRLLAKQGANIAAADVRFEEVQQLASDCGLVVKPYRVDVANVAELRGFVDAVVTDFGRIDVLVNNAGICPRLPFTDSTRRIGSGLLM